MTEKTKVLIVGALASLTAAYAVGRYASPTKVVTEVKTVEVEKKTQDTDATRDKHKETVTTEVVSPDGTKTTTTNTTEDTTTNRQSHTIDDTIQTSQSKQETTYSRPIVTLSALGGLDASQHLTPVYGASASKEILGPIGVGAWGLTSGQFGVSVSLTF